MDLAEPPFDPRRLRDAFGCFATGVTVVTGRAADGTRTGLTANSFTSVSLDPPLLLFCPANGASALPLLRETGRFAINILDLDGQPIADRFTRRGIDRFAEADWIDWDGLPVLAAAKAAFACHIHADHDGGDHRIIVGRITRYGLAPERESLLYLHGRYRRVHVG
ncbi:flavin reductase family protein [Polymorphobacter fuscus]|uniref:Flavin reductase n=1 Tax=Sandarakinorhabdus fusca TaxID=1439888 RepID=A0A7C9KYS0_9SPHN|nr:flavin reductase family protein [Polymorphobacter fuscus]KAB7647960.1 flavin reductase family protein [Polymorphobacter fuscus]MQT17288.1 flavin reductase [Polymorphobacter fuscus]NJC08715.1 flavin reductase (DIM6/NTAB) family NADH-FMN oxidoreductase RutF [Polymorphobacter fuscus]